jgi:phytoene/squalene synthetase
MHESLINSSFKYCEGIAKGHYENFPVASLLIPKEKRKYIYAIYAYARAADDFADEPELRGEIRKGWHCLMNGMISLRIASKEKLMTRSS